MFQSSQLSEPLGSVKFRVDTKCGTTYFLPSFLQGCFTPVTHGRRLKSPSSSGRGEGITVNVSRRGVGPGSIGRKLVAVTVGPLPAIVHSHIGSMGLVYLSTFMVDFHGKCIGKCTNCRSYGFLSVIKNQGRPLGGSCQFVGYSMVIVKKSPKDWVVGPRNQIA